MTALLYVPDEVAQRDRDEVRAMREWLADMGAPTVGVSNVQVRRMIDRYYDGGDLPPQVAFAIAAGLD